MLGSIGVDSFNADLNVTSVDSFDDGFGILKKHLDETNIEVVSVKTGSDLVITKKNDLLEAELYKISISKNFSIFNDFFVPTNIS